MYARIYAIDSCRACLSRDASILVTTVDAQLTMQHDDRGSAKRESKMTSCCRPSKNPSHIPPKKEGKTTGRLHNEAIPQCQGHLSYRHVANELDRLCRHRTPNQALTHARSYVDDYHDTSRASALDRWLYTNAATEGIIEAECAEPYKCCTSYCRGKQTRLVGMHTSVTNKFCKLSICQSIVVRATKVHICCFSDAYLPVIYYICGRWYQNNLILFNFAANLQKTSHMKSIGQHGLLSSSINYRLDY